jgi:hypothetical protein
MLSTQILGKLGHATETLKRGWSMLTGAMETGLGVATTRCNISPSLDTAAPSEARQLPPAA